MALNAVSAGIGWDALRHMKFTHVVQILFEWDDMHADDDREKVREATSKDVRALMNLS